MRHNVTPYVRRRRAFGPQINDLHVVINEDDSREFNVVADSLDEVLDPYRADQGYAVLGTWEDDYARHIDCRVEGGPAIAADYMRISSKLEALAQLSRADVHHRYNHLSVCRTAAIITEWLNSRHSSVRSSVKS